MSYLIQQTLIYAIPLMIVALAGVFAERSGIINLALEGIMIFGAFIGVLFVHLCQKYGVFELLPNYGNWGSMQLFEILGMLISAALGSAFALLLGFAAINLRADQTISGTSLNMLAPAIVLFFVRIIANQEELRLFKGDAAQWFMIKKGMLGLGEKDGFFVNTFLNKVYLATYICIILFVVCSIILYKTRFGLRLRSC
ncbi:MAG: ABC transporter permease, partial [Firmicutes bacterium]|nr:ABC transporter permease [Bacillota bacterium]